MSHTVATTIQLLPSVANSVATTCTPTAATTRRITVQTSASSNRHRFTASRRFMLDRRYRPWNHACRFCENALIPSWKSPVKPMLAMASVSASSCVARSASQLPSNSALTRA